MALCVQQCVNIGGPVMVSVYDAETGAGSWLLFDSVADYEIARTDGTHINTGFPAHEGGGSLPGEYRRRLELPERFDCAAWVRSATVDRGSGAPAPGAGVPARQSTRSR